MTAKITAFALVVTIVASAQETTYKYGMPKHTLELVQRHNGILDAQAKARTGDRTVIGDVSHVLSWLVERYGVRPAKTTGKPLNSFLRDFQSVISKDEVKEVGYVISVSVQLLQDSKEAGERAAMHLYNIPVRFDITSFSGAPVGDWTETRYEDAFGANLVFLRRNAYVHVSYEGPYEVSRQNKDRPRLNDATLRQKCEELARNIDDLLVRAPAVKLE